MTSKEEALFKVERFMKDIKKFNERSEKRKALKEKASSKALAKMKKQLPNRKGLFENGVLGKSSYFKGPRAKLKERLTSDLLGLMGSGKKQPDVLSPDDPVPPSASQTSENIDAQASPNNSECSAPLPAQELPGGFVNENRSPPLEVDVPPVQALEFSCHSRMEALIKRNPRSFRFPASTRTTSSFVHSNRSFIQTMRKLTMSLKDLQRQVKWDSDTVYIRSKQVICNMYIKGMRRNPPMSEPARESDPLMTPFIETLCTADSRPLPHNEPSFSPILGPLSPLSIFQNTQIKPPPTISNFLPPPGRDEVYMSLPSSVDEDDLFHGFSPMADRVAFLESVPSPLPSQASTVLEPPFQLPLSQLNRATCFQRKLSSPLTDNAHLASSSSSGFNLEREQKEPIKRLHNSTYIPQYYRANIFSPHKF